MSNKSEKIIDEYGLRVFRSSHKSIRKLKHFHTPSLYGFRVWPSSWLLMDYFKHCKFARDSKIIDIGCGWGLAGIYCAKNHNSIVTCVDSDAAVFPYLRLHARINYTEITMLKSGFEDLSVKQMKSHQVMIGSDICFWDGLVDILIRLILRAFESGIKTVIISDPGRSSFESLGRYFIDQGKGQIMNREVNHPYRFQGRILVIK